MTILGLLCAHSVCGCALFNLIFDEHDNSFVFSRLNLSTATNTDNVEITLLIELMATKIGLLVLLVGFMTFMHSLNKQWTIDPWLLRKHDKEDEAKKRE